MAGLNDNLDKANKLLKQIEAVYKRLGETNPFNGMDPEKISTSEKEIKKLEVALEGITNKAYDLEEGFGGITAAIGASLAEMNKTDNAVNRTVKSMRGIKSITQDLANDQSGLSQLSLKELQNRESKLKTLSQEAKTQSSLVKQQYEGFNLDKNGNKLSGAALDARLKKLNISKSEAQKIEEILAAEEEGLTVLDDALDKTKERIKYEESINKKLGITGGLLKGISKIPILGDVFDANEAVSEMDKHLRAGGSSAGALGAGIKNIGKQIKEGVLNPANMIVAAFTFIVKAFGESQKGISDLARGLGMSASRATVMRQEFADIANSSMNANLTVKALQESQLAVGQALGTNAMLNEKDLETMTDIVKKTGLQHSELIGIEKLSLATGKSLDSNVKSALGGATAFASQNKLVVDNNKVLREVNKASSSLKLSLGGSVEELGKAVVQAQKFGINLEQAESIASSMLDFESSIEAELSAELLTGKNINLEKARGLALEGKSSEAAAEILKQVGGTAEFSKMNVIQQEAMAKAVGLTREGLADSLIEREALAAMSAEEGETTSQAYERLKASGKTEAEIIELLGEKTAQQLEQQSSQDKFNASVEKLKEIFVQVMDAVAPIFDVLSSIAEVVMPSINFLLSPLIEGFSLIGGLVSSFVNGLKEGKAPAIALAAILGTIAAPLIASAIGAIFKSFAAIPFGIGIPLAGVAVAGLFSLLSKGESKAKQVSDAAIDPKGGLIVSGPKGTYQGDPNDTIIMGTGIGKGKGKTTPQQGGGGGGTVNIDMTQTNALLQQLINLIQTGGNVILDGQKVGTALKLGSFKTQ